MRTIDYDKQESYTGNTSEHMAVDVAIDKKFGNIQHAYEEGFASSDGVRGGTAESDGSILHPEHGDNSIPSRTPESIDDENPGLADS